MTSVKLMLTGAQAYASVNGPLTSGMVGIPVTIEYDEAWDGLTKNLMCRCSPWGSDEGEIRTILNVGEASAVAHEVMQSSLYLYLGVEGFSSDGKLVIPTTWARCGKKRVRGKYHRRSHHRAGAFDLEPASDGSRADQARWIHAGTIRRDPSLCPVRIPFRSQRGKIRKQRRSSFHCRQQQRQSGELYAKQAHSSAEAARTSAGSAANLANGALQAQRAAEAAAQRAEAAAAFGGSAVQTAVVMIRTVLSGCDLSNPTVLHTSGTAYETEIKPRDHHVVGSVYVEVGGVDVTKDVYDPAAHIIHISAPKTDVLIEAICPERQSDKTVDLVLFSGQSNMSGRGDGSLATVCPEGEGYWYKDGTLVQIAGDFGNESNSTGSMVSSVAKAYFDSCGVPIAAVSYSSGGTKIAQFAPDEAFYQNGATLYNEAAAYLEAQGYTIRKKAMVWCQGESDAYDGTSQADYEAAFLAIRDALKTDCGIT